MQTDYAGHTIEVVDPATGEIRQGQISVAVLGASSLTFAMASLSQRLPRLDRHLPAPYRFRHSERQIRAGVDASSA